MTFTIVGPVEQKTFSQLSISLYLKKGGLHNPLFTSFRAVRFFVTVISQRAKRPTQQVSRFRLGA